MGQQGGAVPAGEGRLVWLTCKHRGAHNESWSWNKHPRLKCLSERG